MGGLRVRTERRQSLAGQIDRIGVLSLVDFGANFSHALLEQFVALAFFEALLRLLVSRGQRGVAGKANQSFFR